VCAPRSFNSARPFFTIETSPFELTNPPLPLIIFPFHPSAARRRELIFLEAIMRKNLWALAALVILLSLVLAACGGAGSAGGKDPAAAAVENYLSAVVKKDSAKVSSLACKAWESQALLEMDGFQAVTAELANVSCKNSGADGSATLVSCTGSINTTYNTEKQSLDLSRQTYKVVQEGGDYRVCGYK
jgi:hypothetical protein